MDRFTKIMLALIVCLLAIIAFKPQTSTTTVQAAIAAEPGRTHRYQLVFISPDARAIGECSYGDASVKDVNAVAADGWEAVSMTTQLFAGCAQYSVLMRK